MMDYVYNVINMVVEKGTIKVVWITKNTKRIYSKMFDSVKEAEKFGRKKKDYIISRLLWQKRYKTYAWEILPHGNYKLYLMALRFYQRHKGKKAFIKRLFRM